jgi:NADH-quinone oxidoreductase subunit A
MVYNYIFIGLLILVAAAFAAGPLLLVSILAPKKKSKNKSESYECGVITVGDSWLRFRMQYYLYAILFVLFDIETVFLYPWAVSYGGLGFFALIEMIIFVAMLLIGLAYAWARGALRWQ